MLELQQKIKEAGLKVTHPRLVVLSLIQEQAEDLTVKQIYQKLYIQKQKLSLATVYRVVSDLEGAGLISNTQFQRGEAKFNLSELANNQLLQIYCAELTQAKQEQFLASLQSVFTQFQVDLKQIEIIQNH
ncbi:Fur family transcriptional regulator [Acinetobacter nosocomialis]|jgi:Fur family ferric uptake transcriptional regulator|uniref:Ferric uptake regulation protein n=2 Tax=Acinetobacter nosocomialis TaxID=106654 RepID=A0AB36M5W7_ACINO|nr:MULTISPECIES: transcriptional repressor [Acinetobacter]KCZ31228.1 ferric uptake regulator family protein [Acinetobacter baumannii 25977_9]MDQ9824636.1 transcriptional repressor [Acinetobacter sp. 163]AZC03437.1 transcriptional repressor [Acinetobacter nosocomialis]AZC05121.1 transcriptional repressor [Acinetobacter nosocomialis]EHU1210977.1 transcriptional repressor [Acinetobacter nosocomialis]